MDFAEHGFAPVLCAPPTPQRVHGLLRVSYVPDKMGFGGGGLGDWTGAERHKGRVGATWLQESPRPTGDVTK